MTDKDSSGSADYNLPEDWRGEVMSKVRVWIKQADSEITEVVKWKTASNPGGVLAWYKDGLITTGEMYKKHLRLSLAKGSALKAHDPKGLINSYRAILIHEDDNLNETAFKQLIREAVKLNVARKKATKSK